MANLVPRISVTQNFPFQQLAQVTSVAGVISGAAGFGSSLFLQRLFLPGEMLLSEVDLALGISFSTTSNGAGTLARSLIVYSFANSTSLAALVSLTSGTSTSLVSASGITSWITGLTPPGGSSLTQVQGGWAGSVLAAMTFTSSALQPGDYVIGHMLDFTQATPPWTVSLFGLAGPGISSSSAALLSAAGLSSVSALDSNGTVATITVFTGAPTAANVLSSGNLASVSGFTSTTSVSVFSSAGVTVQSVVFGRALTTSITASSQLSSITLASLWTASPVGATALASAGLASGYFISTTAASVTSTAAVISSAGLGSYAVGTGSYFTQSRSTSAVTQVGSSSLPTFTYVGNATGGTQTSAFPSAFIAGILATGSLPTSLALTTAGLTLWTSGSCIQPWFCLIGA
jgi:hypothetical protein